MDRVTICCERCGAGIQHVDVGQAGRVVGQHVTRAMMDHVVHCPHYEAKVIKAREDAAMIARAMTRAD